MKSYKILQEVDSNKHYLEFKVFDEYINCKVLVSIAGQKIGVFASTGTKHIESINWYDVYLAVIQGKLEPVEEYYNEEDEDD